MVTDIIKNLKDVSAEILPKYPVIFAYVYGSYATDTAHPFSDLDIGVYLHHEYAGHILKIELDLSLEFDRQLGHIIETEVRAINDLPLTFLGQILTEGILIYSRDESARVDFEVGIRKRYFDFVPVIKNYNKSYMEAMLTR